MKTSLSVILAFSILLLTSCDKGTVPKLNLPNTGERYGYMIDPCDGKDRCVLVYLAPWCPACHASIGFLKDMRNRLEPYRAGLKIVIGSGEDDELEEMAALIGGQVYMDKAGEFKRAMGGSAVPRWWVADEQGKVLNRFSGGGASGGTPEQNFEYFNKYYLKLGT